MSPKKLLQILCTCTSLCSTTLGYSQTLVTIDGKRSYQTIHGWGGNTYGWILNGWNDWTNDRVYDVAYNELGVTHLRLVTEFEVWEPENDDGDPNHFNWPYYRSRFEGSDTKARLVQSDFMMMERILNTFHKRLILGIWNVPQWMARDPARKDHRDLPYHMHAEFAESVAAYLLWARTHRGLVIPEIILANEPDGTYVEYSPEELRDLIKTVGAKFKREGIVTKIAAPDLASPYFDPDIWVTRLLEDSVAASYLSAISYHTYYVEGGPDMWNAKFQRLAELAARAKLPVYFTEVGTTPWSIPNSSWAWAFDCAQMWHNVLTYGNASVSYQWALLGKDYVVNPDATRNPIFYALAQFFQHIPVGAVRVAVTSNHRDLLVSAFKHEVRNSMQIVFLNRAHAELRVNVDLQNLLLANVTCYRTSEHEQHVRLADMFPARPQFSFTIPAHTIVTLSGTIGADSAAPTTPEGLRINH